jgi:hypothetical protein
MRLASRGKLDWVNLYRIFEVIAADVGGLDAIASYGWASKASMKLFKRTACSPGAVGLDARHGTDSTPAPSKPMVISEARNLINAIIRAWLQIKTGTP